MPRILRALQLCSVLFLFLGCSQTLAPKSSEGYHRIESDLIFSVRYFPDTQVMSVLLSDGKGYDYQNVPEETYKAFIEAESQDEYFRAHVQDQFEAVPWNI